MKLPHVIGPMLGVSHNFVAGTLLTERRGSQERTAFWVHRNRWRIEVENGPTHIITADNSVTIVPGHVERGPRMSLLGMDVPAMLMPRYALIWGRPGEDWRLTDEISDSSHGLVEITLESIESPLRGYAVVDPLHGVIHELALGDVVHRLTDMTSEPDRPVDEYYEVPPA